MKTNQDGRIEESGWPARSVLVCGGKRSATPLSVIVKLPTGTGLHRLEPMNRFEL